MKNALQSHLKDQCEKSTISTFDTTHLRHLTERSEVDGHLKPMCVTRITMKVIIQAHMILDIEGHMRTITVNSINHSHILTGLNIMIIPPDITMRINMNQGLIHLENLHILQDPGMRMMTGHHTGEKVFLSTGISLRRDERLDLVVAHIDMRDLLHQKLTETTSSHRVIREEYDSDSDNNDYGANSDAESIQSVREITDRTSQLSTDHQSDDEQAMTYKEWTDQEKKEYHDRLELVIALLGDEIQMPELIKTPTTSGARGPVVIKTKPEVLPPAPFVSKKFADHLERAESMVEKVDVIKKPKKEKPEGEDPQQTQVEQPSKVQVGLHLRPFNPTWLYKVTKEPWPKRVLPDTAIRQLTVNKEPPLEDYLISRAHVHKVQITSCLQMNAASHLDWYLIAMNKILTELQEECDDQEPRYKALQDLRHATAYANEYITDQAIFNHAGMTNLMREHYLKQMVGLENEEYNDLITQPYDSLAAFNGAVDTLLKEKAVRDRCAAFQKMARDNPTPAQSSTTQKNSDIVQKIYDKKYGKTSTKASKKPNYGPFDSKGKRKSNIKSDGQWSKSSNTSKSFPFPKPKQHRRKPKKGSYKPKSGGRGRDHN
mgnify:CR=1 FL=1